MCVVTGGRGALAKARRHKSAKPWQIKSLSGSCEQIAPMHASRDSSLPLSLSLAASYPPCTYVSRHLPLFLRFSFSPGLCGSFLLFLFRALYSTVGMGSTPIHISIAHK